MTKYVLKYDKIITKADKKSTKKRQITYKKTDYVLPFFMNMTNYVLNKSSKHQGLRVFMTN